MKIDILGDGTLELVVLIPNRIRNRKHLLVHILTERRSRVGKPALARCFQIPARRAEFRLSAFKLQSTTRNKVAILGSIVNVNNPFAPLLRLLIEHGTECVILRYLLETL